MNDLICPFILDKALTKSSPNVVIACFDLQKVLPCPFLQTGVSITKGNWLCTT